MLSGSVNRSSDGASVIAARSSLAWGLICSNSASASSSRRSTLAWAQSGSSGSITGSLSSTLGEGESGWCAAGGLRAGRGPRGPPATNTPAEMFHGVDRWAALGPCSASNARSSSAHWARSASISFSGTMRSLLETGGEGRDEGPMRSP